MDDFEDSRVQRLRSATFRQLSKGVAVSVLKLTTLELDEIKLESDQKALDFYKLVVAKAQNLEYDQVTDADREEAKRTLFQYSYGG